MSSKHVGLIILFIGFGLGYFALYTSDSLFVLQGAALHFLEHMGMLWSQMPGSAQIYLMVGAVIFVVGLIIVLLPRRAR